jgi:glycosyltransferase involved in cell wall biosynthesis
MDLKKSGIAVQPRISVCIASYNGEQFIYEQLRSILAELGPEDEVIICDDCSNDSTCSIIGSFHDTRIKLIKNHSNIGYVKNFENALSLATGQFVFLSDQDDVWVEGKVRKVLAAFQKDPDITLVYHNLEWVDVSGNKLDGKFPKYPGGVKNSFMFLIRQLFKAQIYGCACCLNRSKIDGFFPFPESAYAHDHWISVWAAVNGRVLFIEDALVKHRKHHSNITPERRFPFDTILRLRSKYLMQIVTAIYRRIFNVTTNPWS